MNYTELVEDFVAQGSLPAEQEQHLFSALAADEELRADFKLSLAMKSAVRNDRAAFVPPPSSVNAVFARLGYSAPIGAAGGAALASRLRDVFSGSNVGAALVGACVMGLAILGIDAFNTSANSLEDAPLADAHSLRLPENHAAEDLSAAAAVAEANAVNNSGSVAAAGSNTVTRAGAASLAGNPDAGKPAAGDSGANNGGADNGSADNLGAENLDVAAGSASTAVAQANNTASPPAGQTLDANALGEASGRAAGASNLAENSQAQDLDPTDNLNGGATATEDFEAEDVPVLLAQSTLKDFELGAASPPTSSPQHQDFEPFSIFEATGDAASEVEIGMSVRSLAMQSVPSSDVASGATSGLNDFGLAFNFDFGSNAQFVFEIGREEFLLDYERQTPDGLYLLSKTHRSSMLWGTLGMRYSPFEPGLAKPYVQFALGGAAIGALGRAQLGIESQLSNNVSAVLGLETSYLLFPVDGVWFNTQNIGLTYGISYRF